MTTQSLRVLLEGLIDYAGLFPPAGLSMEEAVRNYAGYREGEYAWALGRFVVPDERMGEVPPEFPLSVLGMPGPSADSFEVKAATLEDVERIAGQAGVSTVYVEITDLTLLDAIAMEGLRAKLRTGGVTPEAFPEVERLAEFIRACREKGVAFKATAGLHHPLRCVKPLTYEPDAPIGTMHGFLNVFLAAAFEGFEEEVLREISASAFSFDDAGASWRGRRVSLDGLRAMRELATSFGSCSFEEPIDDLISLGWL